MTLTLVQFEYAWEIHAYLRLAGIYYEEENRDYPISVINDKQAYLVDGTIVVSGDRVLQYLKDNYTNLDLDYSDVERAEISIYSYVLSTVGKTLYNKRKWFNWGNVKKTIQNCYQPILGLPYSLYYGCSCWNANRKEVHSFFSVTKQSEAEALQVLESCYAFIQSKLQSQKQPDFIFGYRPSTLDVMLFSHIARIKEYPNSLQHVIAVYPELIEFYERMLSGYFVPLTVSKDSRLSTNSFLHSQNMFVELSSKKLCYVERKTPIVTEEEKELTEEERILKEEEARLQKSKNWRIGLFSLLAVAGVSVYIMGELPQLLSMLDDD